MHISSSFNFLVKIKKKVCGLLEAHEPEGDEYPSYVLRSSSSYVLRRIRGAYFECDCEENKEIGLTINRKGVQRCVVNL